MDNVSDFFDGLNETLASMPGAHSLRELRDNLDDPSLLFEVKRYVAGINDPDTRVRFLALLRRLRRTAEERCEKRKLHKDLSVQGGVAGGLGLVGGSIVAVASATFPAIVIIPIVGGAWMVFVGFTAAQRLDEERHLYEQIASQMKTLIESVP